MSGNILPKMIYNPIQGVVGQGRGGERRGGGGGGETEAKAEAETGEQGRV